MSDRPTIVLTGFMGTGKSTVGRVLAERLGMDVVDTDALIEERHGPIERIFAERGEEAFREIERQVAAELADRTDVVVSTGGRMMLDPENVASFGGRARIVCLVADPDEILARITADGSRIDRPLLQVDDPGSRIRELLAEREAGYGRFPQVRTDGRRPEAIVDELVALVDADDPPALPEAPAS